MSQKIYVFDDGSIGSKLLQHEYKDKFNIDVVKVNESSNLVGQFTKFNNNNGIKIYLPFNVEQLAANNEQLRKDIQTVETLGFKNLIVLPYEGDSENEINARAKIAKITQKFEVLKGEEVNEEKKPYKSVRTDGREVQHLS